MKKLLFLLVLSTNLYGTTYEFKKSKDNKVSFHAVGSPGLLNIEGEGAYLEGMVHEKTAVLNVQLSNLTTSGNLPGMFGLRDKHMKEKYLEVDKYPKAELVIKNLPVVKEGEEFVWNGELTLKNNTKPVQGKALLKGKHLSAKFNFKLTDYPEIGAPCHMGVCVGEDISVSVDAVAK